MIQSRDETVDSLRQRLDEQRNKIADLEREVAHLKETIRTAKAEYQELNTTIETKRLQNEKRSSRLEAERDKRFVPLREELERLEAEVAALEQQCRAKEVVRSGFERSVRDQQRLLQEAEELEDLVQRLQEHTERGISHNTLQRYGQPYPDEGGLKERRRWLEGFLNMMDQLRSP